MLTTNTFLDELREDEAGHSTNTSNSWMRISPCSLDTEPILKNAFLENRTPHELVTKGEMVNFGAVIYVKRLHSKKKKEKVWNPGIFLGKTENDLFITHHADAKTSRSARAVGEPYSSKKVPAVDYFSWEVRTSTLTQE